MSEEIGSSTPLGQLRPMDRSKDTGQRPSERDLPLQRRRPKVKESPEEEEKGHRRGPEEGGEPSSAGKIVDIVI
ncbi:MAG: hypothetical protein N3G78_06280 [Desulfobacterota bacterium]|nr:hypothetical protein [Thermodesulfobacteriota bacterium]